MIVQFDTYYIDRIQEKDAWKICDFIVANEDRLRRFFPKTLEQGLTPSLAERFCKKKVKQFEHKEEFLFTVKAKESNALVGLIYIKDLDWTKKLGEFAYCIGYPFEGKGITSKAVNYLSEYAFNNLGFEVLQIIAYKANIGSVKIAKHNGFKWIKTLEKEFTPIGEKPLDMELYILYNEK
ncbi:GNAT family N-acetyltransferase [Lacinutrix iliipiscaria]|uniref:GNAT family N-acetyltransferase n=1 Tax=Lacinutrix iliipiscaria TaxID=1230532 RepID=A0ABW5WII5_9FLAO